MGALDTLDREARALGIALHSVELTVDRATVLSAGSAPLGVDTPHRMYSVTKSLTGLAVGLLADEGGLSLDDPVVRHFPERGPVHHWVEQATLRHLLAMLGPHAATTYAKDSTQWLASWFATAPAFPPGAVFTYDTSGSYVLAALVERVAGTTLAEYLRRRLAPIGLSDDLRVLPGPDGVSHGGSGLVCRPGDLLRLAHLLLDDGVHDGEALLPAAYLRQATTVQADTAAVTWGGPFRGGYGYQLWLPERGGHLMFGLGGQIVYCAPEHRLALVVTADTLACQSGDQRLVDLVFRHLVDPFVTGEQSGRVVRGDRVQGAGLGWPSPPHRAEHAVTLRGRYASCEPGCDAGLELELGADGGLVASPADGWRLELRLGEPIQAVVPLGRGPRPAVVTAGWVAPRTLDVECRTVDDELEVMRLRLHSGPDGTLTARGQGFGEQADPRWTFARAYTRT